MSKTRLLFGVNVTVMVFAVSIAPASAWFQSENGKATAGNGSASPIVFSDEGASVECQKAEGGWQIQEFTKQAAVSLGQHLLISISKWNECTAFGSKSEVKPCQFQAIQVSKGQTNGVLFSDITECIVKAAGLCEIKVPVSGNQNNGKVGLLNSGLNLIAGLDVVGIESVATGFCVGVKNLTNEVGKLEGTFTGVALKEV